MTQRTIPRLIVGNPTPVHEDGRRAIAEFNSQEGDFSMQFFEVKQRIPLGNHYHAGKTEIFIITKGCGTLITCPVDEHGTRLGEPETVELAEQSTVMIPPYLAHTFVLEPCSRMFCLSSKPFDPTNKDMHAHVLP